MRHLSFITLTAFSSQLRTANGRSHIFQKSRCLIILWQLLTSTSAETLLRCHLGEDVHFKCPCCPDELESFRFKKLFKGGFIVRDGNLEDHSKFEFNEHKDRITLKKCDEDDEGTYIWMCGRSNTNKHFHLEVLPPGETLLRCHLGEDVHFKCPCCPDELDSFRFKKLFKGGFIVRDGNLGDHSKFKLIEHKDRITLKKCDKDDKGTYIWMCGRSNTNKHFHLVVLPPVLDHLDHLKCFIGGNINFDSPCPGEVDTCSFKKQSELLIMRHGILTLNKKYTCNKNRTHITLKGCDKDDEGTYVWMCGKADLRKTFVLTINKDAAHLSDDILTSTPSRSSAISPEWLYEMVIKIYLYSRLKTPFQDI